MRLLLRLIFLIFCCTGSGININAQSKTCTQQVGKVVKVIDGDTFDVRTVDSIFRVRLYGIDAPERGQEFYQESKQLPEELTADKKLVLEIKGKDVYGRTVADIVRVTDSLNINYEMVKRGMAWHFTRYSDNQQLAKLEVAAREKQIGIWSIYHFLAPWEFRKH